MKKLGRVIMVVCAVMLMVVMATACGGSEDTKTLNVEGSWKRALNDGMLTPEQVQIYTTNLEGLPSQDVVLKFESGSKLTVTAKVDGKETSSEGSYRVEGDYVTVIDPTGYAAGTAGTFKMSRKNDRLLIEGSEYQYVCFVKQ